MNRFNKGCKIEKQLEWIMVYTLVQRYLYSSHRKTKVAETKTLPDFIISPDSA